MNYPIGIQDFEKIRRGGYLYVDKTRYVYDIVSSGSYYFLSRPRRFGKSLLMSTIRAYFEGRSDLFEGLWITGAEKVWSSYEVLRLDFSAENYNDKSAVYAKINEFLSEWEERYGLTGSSEKRFAERFGKIIYTAYRASGKGVVILIDEYDKPILDTLQDEQNNVIREELRAFYSVLKASDGYIRFAMLTGVSKFAQVSVFSGLNNLEDISLTDDFNAVCGLTEEELKANFSEGIQGFAEKYGYDVDTALSVLRTNYDGYRFSRRGERIYNLFSILCCLKRRELASYWYSTGTPTFLMRLMTRNEYDLTDIEGQQRSGVQLEDITHYESDLVPLLYQSGYLTIKDYDANSDRFTLGFPNQEVSKSFTDSLAQYYLPIRNGRSVFDLRSFIRDVNSGDPESFMLRLKSLFADISSEPERDKEIHFQNVMYLVAKLAGSEVKTERHSSRGRCDMVIETPKYVYIFEFKIDSTSEKALAQIQEKGYAERYLSDNRTVFLIGANFSTNTRTLTDWKITNA